MSEQLIPTEPGRPGMISEVFEPQRVWTSLDLKDERNAALYLAAKSAPDFGYEDVQGTEFCVTDAIMHTCQLADRQTGELVTKVRTILITDDGTSIGFVSTGVVNSLRDLMGLYGQLPWKPGRRLRVVQRTTSGGNRVYNLALPHG